MTVKVIYPSSDKDRVRWMERIREAVNHDETAGNALFTGALRNKTRSLDSTYNQQLDVLRQLYESRRTAVARRRSEVRKLKRRVRAARNVLYARVSAQGIEATRLDLYKLPVEAFRAQHTNMDDWLISAKNLIKGDIEAEALGLPVLLEPSRAELESQAAVYETSRQTLAEAKLRIANQQNLVKTIRKQVFSLHRELFAWLKSKYFDMPAPERRMHMRAAGFDFVGDGTSTPTTGGSTSDGTDPGSGTGDGTGDGTDPGNGTETGDGTNAGDGTDTTGDGTTGDGTTNGETTGEGQETEPVTQT